MSDFKRMTPNRFKTVWSSFSFDNMYSERLSGTFNSVAYTAAGTSNLKDRFYFNSFADTGTEKNACQFASKIPNDYKAGTDIKIRVIWTSAASTGNIKMQVGLSKMSSTDVYSNDTDCEYLTFTTAATGDGTLFKPSDSGLLTFNGSTLNAGENFSIIVTRDTTDGADTLSLISYVNHVVVYYQRETYQTEASSNFKMMTPKTFKTVYRTMTYHGGNLTGNAGTFNSLVCAAGTGVVLNDRWRSSGFADAAKQACTMDFVLPVDFVAGLDFVIEVAGYTASASTDNVLLGVGIQRAPIGSNYPDDATTIYSTGTVTLTAAFDKKTKTFTFASTTFVAGDIVGLVFYREGDNGSDTASVAWRETQISIAIPINTNGVETVV